MKHLLQPQQLFDYQRECIMHQLHHNDSMLWLQMGLGKEQPNSEPILTPGGWIPIGDIEPGMWVIGADGLPAEIESVYPQGNKEVVTITFNDGSSTRCGWDHLWNVKTNNDIGKGWKTLTTKEIVDSGLRYDGRAKNLKWFIPMTEPVQYPHRNLPLDPYILGVILGDGYVSEHGGVMLCTDTEIVNKCDCSAIKPHETSFYTSYGYVPGMKKHLRDMELMDKRSWEKHVPEIYLRSSIKHRIAILQGLFDTDGSPIDKGGIEFSSTSEMLADAVVELAQSLGGVARKKGPRITQHQNGDGRPSWRVNIKLPSQFVPFTLQRKLDKWIQPTKYQPNRRIKSVEVTGKEQSTCIYVLNKDHLYLTRNHIVTHNTPITLTTIVERMRSGTVNKTLIFGPLRVIQAVWAREARKWEHTKHLRFSVIHGNKEKRGRALFADADIYLVNYESMNWLAEELDHYYISQDKQLPFEMIVYDEVSKMKNSTTLRMAGGKRDRKDHRGNDYEIKVTGWRKILKHFKYRTGLTGTPASNGYLDLHGQFLAVDGGKRLGEFITHYKDNYFSSDYNGWKYSPTIIGKQLIEHKISDITKKMDAKDYLDLPESRTINVMVDLPVNARKAYNEVEADMFTQLDNGSEIEVFSKSAISNKCLQFANGSPYLSSKSNDFEELHDAKLDALESVIEEAGGSPVLCSYTFKSDAERIMKKFKKYRPVNLTAASSKDTESIINKWNTGQIKLLIGHPACLHPSTELLTEHRGWVKLIDVRLTDRVFDGVEFVSHNGCSYSGYKEVVNVFGVIMTPGHKLLIDGKWIEAQNVRNCGTPKRKALYQYKGDDQYISEMFTLRNSVADTSSECNEAQQNEKKVLSALYKGHISQHDINKNLEHLVWNENSSKGQTRQELCRKRCRNVCRVGRFQKLLQRHERRLSGRFNNRASGREQRLFKRQLYMDNTVETTIQQKNKQNCNISRCRNASCRTGSAIRFQQDNVNHEIEQRNDSRSSSEIVQELTIQKKHQSGECQKKRTKVYDLVDCGPRHQFLIRNDKGECFISHNSMGHGIDGLQESGSILVWFGINWSLELYEQMNGRIDRQGQSKPVSIIRILCRDTVDLAVADAIERKTDDQEGLKKALQRYRNGITTNEFDINFF